MNSEPKSDQVDAAKNASSDVLGNAHDARPAFTPGPYDRREREGENGVEYYVASGPFILADNIHGTLAKKGETNATERKATAQLFASAPAMYEALRAMVIVMDRGPQPRKLEEALTWRQCDETARAMADAAIALATTQDNSGS